MKFVILCVVYFSAYLASTHCEENESKPCGCELQRVLGIEPPKRFPNKARHNKPFPSPRSARNDELTPEEHEERVNRGFARIMQFMTFLGHVDNYLTDKASSLIKVMGRAIETGDEEEEVENYNRISRHSPPRISTTITT